MVIPMEKFPGLPLRTIQSFKGQQIVTTIDSVQVTDLSDSDFSVPSGYKELAPSVAPKKDAQTDAAPQQ